MKDEEATQNEKGVKTIQYGSKMLTLESYDETIKRSFSRHELKDLAANFLCLFHGNIPMHLDEKKQEQWLRDDGLISLFIDNIFPPVQ